MTSSTLIPSHLVPGPNLSMEEFCATYEIDEDIFQRLKEQKFKYTNAFKFVELADLQQMGFMLGEIAELRAAIAAWAQMPVKIQLPHVRVHAGL
ncbi:hypothetical protein B0H19DRAFT_1170800 [Mycena capillaripes]|nr:hypothetical protein B0H19DRAFT_1170800 [Mycena capillaripes]